ncbi:MAG TPA: CRTAC1 family protein, partial [Vicinamibacteria bacterium]|nr:CRTAC1 family protein [Vicinamibacteria bacterium]
KESFPADAASAGLQYTELGPYAEAIEARGEPLQPLATESVRANGLSYVEATEDVGLVLEALRIEPPPRSIPVSAYDAEWIRNVALPPLGTGLVFRDLDGDDDPDVVFVRDGAPICFRNVGGRFERVEGNGLPSDGSFVGVVSGDIDNDLDADLYLTGVGANALFLNDGAGGFTASADETVRGDDVSVSASLADVDHDGDLDIYVANYLAKQAPEGVDQLNVPFDLPGAPNRLYRNNGNGTFTETAQETRTDGGAKRSLVALFSDLDEDRDIDFIVVNDGAPSDVFSNDRVGTFTKSAVDFGVETGARTRGVDSGDFDRDGFFDLFFTAEGSSLNLLLRGAAGNGFRPDVLSTGLLAAGTPGARYGASFLDADNDVDLDLAVVVNEAEALAAYYESLSSGFVRAANLQASVTGEGRGLAVADVDSDGDLDLLVGTNRGELAYFRNEGGSRNARLRIRAQGLRSNLDGLGTKVEVRVGDASLRREVRSSSGYFSQSELPLHFGLGNVQAPDYVRFLWPGGVKQIEMDIASGVTAKIEELNRKGTSCPILYAWDGERVRFVTDFLGGSAIGNLLAPGVFNTPDTDEVVKLEAFPVEPRDGAYDVRWVNQLEEVILYDKAALLAVDHPKDVEVFANERLMPGPPYPEQRFYAVRDVHGVTRAVDHRGVDVTERLRSKDRTYPDGFALLPFKGYAEEHTLTLDLGFVEEGKHYVLLLYGWVDYADSSSNLAASQAGVQLVTPYLDAGDGTGRFDRNLPQMGFPAGLPKTMLVDLEGLVDPKRSHVRITTSMRLYWDWIGVAEVVPDARLTVTELPPSTAELSFLGYPDPFDPDGRAPSLYTYDTIRQEELWDAHEGAYTRYGDVSALLEAIDDRYVITHHGDEVRLGFEASRLPQLAPGRRRSLFAFADGFGKDMDLNSARPHQVEPLPFHGMPSYPYPEETGFPETESLLRYREEYNTRYVGRRAR